MYWQKSSKYQKAARENLGNGHDDPAAANAVNAVINAVDAVCVHYLGLRAAGGAHHEALAILATTGLPQDTRAALERHLSRLLGMKNLAQYEGRLVTVAEARAAVGHMDRAVGALAAWASANGF